MDQNVQASLCWLEQNRGDHGNWEEVLRHWKATSAARLKELIVDEEFEEEDLNDDDSGGKRQGSNDRGNKEKEKAKGKGKGKKKKAVKQSLTREQFLKLRRKYVDGYTAKYPVYDENNAYMLVSS